jgi:ketosteroid isomerase-like protein
VVDDPFQQEQEIIKNILVDIFNVAKAKDMATLNAYHLNSPKYSKFNESETPLRVDYAAAKKSEEDFFMNAAQQEYKLNDIKVDVFDNTAISTFLLAYDVTFDGRQYKDTLRGTLVFVKDRGNWKIAHEHFSVMF